MPRKKAELRFIEIKGEKSDAGSEAIYYSLGKQKYGIKLYRTKKLAISSYERQKIAFINNLAPEVGDLISAKIDSSPKIMYGYETKRAKWISSAKDIEIYDKQSKNLFDSLFKLGLSGDFGTTNCGIIKDKLVFIDFGSHSSSSKW